MNQGVHTVDLLLWLLGDIARVQARTATMLHAIETEDTAVAVLEFAIGAIGTLEATTAAYLGYPRRLKITGSLGTVVLEHDRIVAADFRDGQARLVDHSHGARTRALPPPLSARFADIRPCSKTLSRLSSRTAHPPATAARAAGA